MIAPMNRILLKIHGLLVISSAVFTMVLGLIIWFSTLRTRSMLEVVWGEQTTTVQSLLQQKFDCCGYENATSPAFVTDSTCTNELVAASLQGCVNPFATFANRYLDIVFTGIFGIVGIDVMLLLAIACVSKVRKEKERFRFIDEKNGAIAL